MTGDRAAGTTLLELLVATGIVLLLVGSLAAIVGPSKGGFRAEPAAVDVQQRVRVAADALARDLLAAGSGPANGLFHMSMGATVPSVLPCRIGLRRADPPGTSRGDLVTVLSVPRLSAAAATAGEFQGASGPVEVSAVPGCPSGDSACGLEPGMSVLLVDAGGQWDLHGVAGVAVGTVSLEARGPVSSWRYPPGSSLVPVDVHTYYLRPSTGPDGPQLMRYDGDQSDLPQIDHVVVLSFDYFGEPQPPRLRAIPGPLGERMTYGPVPPLAGEDDPRDAWGPGENCVIATDGTGQVPRLPDLAGPGVALQPMPLVMLSDGPWCPEPAAPNRFDADLLRIRKVRVTLRAEAWSGTLRGADARFFKRPGVAPAGAALVPDQQVTFDAVLRSPGGGR